MVQFGTELAGLAKTCNIYPNYITSCAELGNLVWKCESYPIQMPFKYNWNIAKCMNAFYFPEGGTIILDFS